MRYLCVCLIVAFSASFVWASDITLSEADRNGLSMEWKLGSYEISTVGEYTIVEFSGGCGLSGVGKPSLPSKQVFIEIPRNATMKIQILNPVIEETRVSFPLVPCQEPEIDTIGAENLVRTFYQDVEAYNSTDPFPGNVVEVAYQGILRGRNLVLLRINPFQYIAKTGEMKIYKEFSIRIEFEGNLDAFAETDDAMDPICQALVLNYQPGRLGSLDSVNYLILSVPALETHANHYAQFKANQGYTTKVEILPNNPAVSVVKDTIRRYYPQVKYVLILADHPLIALPTTGVRHPLGVERCRQLGLEDGSVPSDLYYSCLEGNDYYPDVYIGRVPAGNGDEATLLLNKLIYYQTNPPGEWGRRFLLCGEFQYQTSQTNMAERLFCETAFTIHNSLKHKYIFPTKTIGTGSAGLGHSTYYFRKAKDPNDPTRPGTYRSKIRDQEEPVVDCKMPNEWIPNIVSDNVARTNTLAFWNEGCFWVQHRDHGSNTGWGKPSLSKTDVANLKNGNKLPILFSINCLTGSMDYSSDCFVEAALKNPNGGAAAAIGSTRISYSWWNDRLCDGFYTCVFGTAVYDCMDVGVKIPTTHPFSKKLGVVMDFGKMYLALNYPSNPFGTGSDYTEVEFYLFHCIGDPSMEIWTEPTTK